ncbi:Tautomerase/MIF [Lentinula detonsa]|uniref:L-dopachrome isomerase n=1 Tax=Lentinula detonsa TaxID=2804962 RepID=A0AA38URC2_9AGAR|nr:Tautomerase/MIF [Lentinula detonsa]
MVMAITEIKLSFRSSTMPTLDLKTNVSLPDVNKYMLELSKTAAETLGKPEKYINITVSSQPMTFQGTLDPAFQCTVISLGNLDPDSCARYSKTLFEHFERTLGVKDDRGYITFVDPGRSNLGYKGTTFQFLQSS